MSLLNTKVQECIAAIGVSTFISNLCYYLSYWLVIWYWLVNGTSGKRLGGSLSATEAGRSVRVSYHAAESSRALGSSSQISRENGGSGHITESSSLLSNSSHLKRDTSSVSDGRHLVRASNSMHLSDGRFITNCCQCCVITKYTTHLM